MKKSEAIPGTKVIATLVYPNDFDEEFVKYHPEEYGEDPFIGVILNKPASKGKVFVRWEEGIFQDESEKEVEVDLKVLSLLSDRATIEKEFELVEKQIKEKLKEAGKIIKEANKMAKSVGARNLESMHDAIEPLTDAMDSAGWRSSSWGC